MPILKLKTPEAIYINDMVRECHFMIDCACGGKDGKYSWSHYKNADKDLERSTEDYQPFRVNKYAHTFYLSERIFLSSLYNEHREEKGQAPVIIVCNDCASEFLFSHESYLNLRNRMMLEYNKGLSEKLSENEKVHSRVN